jgi:hypothetical protein
MKGLRGGGLEGEEENMRLITQTELAYRSKYDLDALLSLVLREIAYAKEGSPEWKNAMESLANIRQEQAARNVAPRPRGPGFFYDL